MPIFVLLVFVGAALLWLLLSFGFIPIGKLSNRLLKDASDAMSKDEKDEKIEDSAELACTRVELSKNRTHNAAIIANFAKLLEVPETESQPVA